MVRAKSAKKAVKMHFFFDKKKLIKLKNHFLELNGNIYCIYFFSMRAY